MTKDLSGGVGQNEDKTLLWLTKMDDYAMFVGFAVLVLGAPLVFWVLLKPIILGTPL